ncbi:MAG: hypothetical protein ACYC35_23760 [Pirellulales bacterium]
MDRSHAAKWSTAVVLICMAGLAAAPSTVGETSSKETGGGENHATPLQPDEPAAAILRLRKSLGSKLHQDDQAFVEAVRRIDKEADKDRTGQYAAAEGQHGQATDVTCDPLAQLGALRKAGRRLDEAADVLEDQNLYRRADELRRQADQLRADARQIQQRLAAGG